MRVFACLLVLLGIGAAHLSAADNPPPAPATQPAPASAKLDELWADLAGAEPQCTRALLKLAEQREQAMALFKERLKPLNLSADEARALIADLGSDDEAVWKPAFEKLQYFDPRLAIDLPTLMNETNDQTTRTRLVDILCDVPADTYAGKSIQLRKLGKSEEAYNFHHNESSWWAEAKIARLQKHAWNRAMRAIVLLEHWATPEAIALLKDLASGNPDAAPTKAAKEALENLHVSGS
jgi:hypothetical protein